MDFCRRSDTYCLNRLTRRKSGQINQRVLPVNDHRNFPAILSAQLKLHLREFITGHNKRKLMRTCIKRTGLQVISKIRLTGIFIMAVLTSAFGTKRTFKRFGSHSCYHCTKKSRPDFRTPLITDKIAAGVTIPVAMAVRYAHARIYYSFLHF